MNLLLSIIILAAQPTAPIDPKSADAEIVFAADFEAAGDVNHDGWPDGWKRRRGPGYPHYVRIEIAEDATRRQADGNRCLRIDLDGGAAAAHGPAVGVSPRFSYLLEGLVRTERLKHDSAHLSVTLLDGQDRVLETFESPPVREAENWQPIRIGPITTGDSSIAKAIVGLHLRGGARHDLTGAALFDDLRMIRLPRITVSANSRHHIYTDPGDVELTCTVSGTRDAEAELLFELFDAAGTRLASARQPLITSGDPPKENPSTVEVEDICFDGACVWKPPIHDVGFYRIRISPARDDAALLRRELTLAVVADAKNPPLGEYGWSLPSWERAIPPADLLEVLRYAGVNWAKFPVLAGQADGEWPNGVAHFAEQLRARSIEPVGVLDRLPAETQPRTVEDNEFLAALVFSDPQVWRELIDPVMTRLWLKIGWWQLGNDEDGSFVGLPELQNKLAAVKEYMERFGREVRLGVVWNWADAPPAIEHPAWSFLTRTGGPPLDEHQLSNQLARVQTPAAQNWVSLRPLARRDGDVLTRARDLVRRMVVAKVNGAQAVFAAEPFDTKHGLMNPDGTPGELFLPWRTTAMTIAGAEFIGSVQLPAGSRNFVFSRGDTAVMVIWNEGPARETLYLGDDVRVVDVWGRQHQPPQDGHRQAIDVGAMPVFVLGVNEAVARWRMKFDFGQYDLSSVIGRPQQVSLRFHNTFAQGVSGKLTLHAPQLWDAANQFAIRLAVEAGQAESLLVQLRPLVETGTQPVRADFEILADRPYKFSVFRTMHVGLRDVDVQMSAAVDESGRLVVTQRFENRADDFVSFQCSLLAPGRRRQQTQVLNLSRGANTQTYTFADAKELLGKTLWLRAEEINGERVLNHHLSVEEALFAPR